MSAFLFASSVRCHCLRMKCGGPGEGPRKKDDEGKISLRSQNVRYWKLKKKRLAATRVAASGRTWPVAQPVGFEISKAASLASFAATCSHSSGREWPQVATSGRKWPQGAASGRKWPQLGQVAAGASGRKWPQVAA